MKIRPYEPADYDDVVTLAPRLTEGVASWRDEAAVRQAVIGWVRDSLKAHDQPNRAVLVADDDTRGVVGFVTVSEQAHWSGVTDAYIGELVVDSGAERQGIGQRLVRAAEQWAAEQGHSRLTLETGAANSEARAFYARLGYVEEEVRLMRLLDVAE